MRKIQAFLFFISLSLISSAHAKVCFLPGVFGGDTSCLSDAQYANCEGFDQTTPCPQGQEQVSCVKGGKTYYRCYCRADTYNLDEHPEYRCQEGYTTECGCAARHLECSPEYMYESDGLGHCKNYPNTDGVDACVLPNGKTYYKDCKCGSQYQYFCHETGLREPLDERYMCEDPSGVKSYIGCECDLASGWSSNGCRDRWDGCTEPMTYIDTIDVNGNNLRCAQCEEYVCPTIDEFNVLAYFCAKSTEINFDCEDLGYTYAPSGACPADSGNPGEVGVRCPFNRDYMNCQKPENCYPNVFTCEEANPGAVCEQIEGSDCYGVVSCDETNGYRKNGTRCEAIGCPAGYRAGLTTCTKEGESYEYNGMSGGEVCGRCVCSPDSNCVYTANPNDHSSITINNNLYQPIFAGSGELGSQCCNGYYASCVGRCTGRDLKTDADPNMERYEICQACGEQYYTIRTCQSGYEVRENRCEESDCDTVNGYSAGIQGTADCLTGENMYQGAYGWSVETQTDLNGRPVQSGDQNCNRCVCGQPSNPGSGDLCRWNNANKGLDGVLKEEDLCCNGYYKDCFSSAPEGATAEACEDAKATATDEYNACDFGTVCFIRECLDGYRVQNNRCVVAACPAPYTTSNQEATDCGQTLGWNLEYALHENGNRIRSGSFFCTQCVCEAPENPGETDMCRWNKDNKGSADLTDECCNGYYATCTTRCVGLTQDAVTEPAGKYDVAVNDATQCTGCGETLYKAKSCKTENGYDRVGDKCVHTGCAEGYSTTITSADCQSGYEYVVDPNRTDEGTPCGKCEPKGCEAGYALDGDLDSCTNSVANATRYWKQTSEQGTPSGENACYKCEAVSCEEMGGETQYDEEYQYPAVTFDYYNPSTNALENCYILADRTDDERCALKYGSEYRFYTPSSRCVNSVLTLTPDGECYYCASCADKMNEGYYPSKAACEMSGQYRCVEDDVTGCYIILFCGNSYYENNCSKKTPHGSAGWGWTEIDPPAGLTPAYILPRCGTCTALECLENYATNVTCQEGETKICSTSHYAGEEDCCYCPCDAQHRTELEECGDTGSAGWYFRPDDTNRCKLCVAKECDDVDEAYQADPCTSGYNQTPHTVTLGDNTHATCYECVPKTGCPAGEATTAEECGNGSVGASGWTIGTTPTGNKVGEQDCYVCSPKNCEPGDVTTVSACGNGTGGANGWYLGSQPSSYNGDTPCYTCFENASCPSGEILDGGTCQTGYEQGNPTSHFVGDAQCYECKVKTCPSGSATSVENCGNGTVGSLGWILGSNTGQYSGTQACRQCVAKQCSDHNDDYYPLGGCPTGFVTSVTHNNLYLGDTISSCVECQEVGCDEGYSTVGAGCGTGRIIDTTQPGNQSGGETCYKCICDTENGYYETCPNGADCDDLPKVNNCYVPTGCHEGFVESHSSELTYFDHVTMYRFNVGSTEIDCHIINGCNTSVALPLADINQTMFATTCHTVASTTCCEINGCQNGYTLNTPCTGETTATQTDTLLGKTCRKCEDCEDMFGPGAKTSKENDETCNEESFGTFTCYYNCGTISCTDQGYYEFTDTKCDRSLKNVTTSLGSTCKTGDSCYTDSTHGYFYKLNQLQAYFTYNGPNVCGKATNDTLDCYEITGCNRDADSTCWSSVVGTNASCLQEIANKYGVPVSALTFTKKTQGTTNCNALTGCAQTSAGSGYSCSSKTINGQTCYYNCTALDCPSGYGVNNTDCGTGYIANTSIPHATAYSGDSACYLCENCAMRHPGSTTSNTEPSPASDYTYEHEVVNGVDCYYDIVKLSCSSIGMFDECPTGFACTTYNEDCVNVTGCDTTNGYTTTACNSTTQVTLFDETKGGSHCYKCRNKTCAERYPTQTTSTTKPGAGYSYSGPVTVDGQPCYYNIKPKTCQSGVSATSTDGCPSYEVVDTSSILSYAGEDPCYECKDCKSMGGETDDPGDGWVCDVDENFHGITCYFDCEESDCPAHYATSNAGCEDGEAVNTSITDGTSGGNPCYLCEDCAARHPGKTTWTSQPDTNVYLVEGDEDVNGVHCWWGRAKTCVEVGYYSSCPPDRICVSFTVTGIGGCKDGYQCKTANGYVNITDLDTAFTYTESEYNHTASNDSLECYKVTGCDSTVGSYSSQAAVASAYGVPQTAIKYTKHSQANHTCYTFKECTQEGDSGAGYTCTCTAINGHSCCYNCSANTCSSGYATSTSDCASNEVIDTTSQNGYAGDDPCYECKTCSEMHSGGSTTDPGVGWTCSSEAFHNVTCYYDCSEDVCPSGYGTTDAECGTGRKLGTATNGSSGGVPCKECICNENQGYYSGSCPDGAACTTVNGCYRADSCKSGWVEDGTEGLEYYQGNYNPSSHKTFIVNGSEITCVLPGNCYSNATSTAPSTTIKTYFNYSSYNLGGTRCYFPTSCKKSGYENLGTGTCTSVYGNYYYEYDSRTWVNMTCTKCSQRGCQDIDADYYNDGACPSAFTCVDLTDPSWCETPNGCSSSYQTGTCDSSTQNQDDVQSTHNGNITCYKCSNKGCTEIHPNGSTSMPEPEEGWECDSEMVNGGMCYFDCEGKPCVEGYATSDYECDTGRILGSTQHGYSGEHPCYSCECDIAHGYYSGGCPTGAVCSNTLTNGCYRVTGCNKNGGYVPESWRYFFTYNPTPYTFITVSGNEIRCYLVTGCASGLITWDEWEAQNYGSWFSIDDTYDAGSYECVRIDGCASGKYEEDDCSDGQSFENTRTLNNYTCGDCVDTGCNEANGYYETCPTGAYCPSTLVNGCYTPLYCDESQNYMDSDDGELYHWAYNSTPVTFKRTNGETYTCYKITGCHSGYLKRSVWNSGNYGTWFEIDDIYEFGSFTGNNACVRADMCRDPKVTASECHLPHLFSNTKTANGMTCGDCGGCDDDEDYYIDQSTCRNNTVDPAHAVCEEFDGCYKFDHFNCTEYVGSSGKWIVNQHSTWNHPDNIEECQDRYGSSYYPTQTTATCGYTTYRKCEIQTTTCYSLDSDYTSEWEGSETTLSGFYEKVTNFQGSGLTCYSRDPDRDWSYFTGWSQSRLVTCTFRSNKKTYSAQAFYIEGHPDADDACDITTDDLDYSTSVIAQGFNFAIADKRGCSGNQFYEYVSDDEIVCYYTSNGRRYETHIDDSANRSVFDNIFLILSTPDDDNNFWFRAQPSVEVQQCCGRYHSMPMNEMPACSRYKYHLDGTRMMACPDEISGNTCIEVPGCGDFNDSLQ